MSAWPFSGASLRLEHDYINGFADNGVLDTNAGQSTLVISDSTISDNYGDGVLVAPRTSGKARAVLESSRLEGDKCGLVVTTFSTGSSNCGTGTAAVATSATVTAFQGSMALSTSTVWLCP